MPKLPVKSILPSKSKLPMNSKLSIISGLPIELTLPLAVALTGLAIAKAGRGEDERTALRRKG